MTWLSLLYWTTLGLVTGSFIDLLAERLPRRLSIVHPPSHCRSCRRQLTPLELIPVISYLVQGGRCRTCGAPIGLRTLMLELGTGFVFALAAHKMIPTCLLAWARLTLTCTYLAVLLLVTTTDLEHGLIPNSVILPATGLAAAHALFTGWPALLPHLAGGALGAGVMITLLFLAPDSMGWGDVRLAGFIGLTTGLPGLWIALFLAFVSGGLVAATLLLTNRRDLGGTMPLGPFLALGATIVLLYAEPILRILRVLVA